MNTIIDPKTISDPSEFIKQFGGGAKLYPYQKNMLKLMNNSNYGKGIMMHARQSGKSMLASQLMWQQQYGRMFRVQQKYIRTFKVKFVGKFQFILNKESGVCRIIRLNIAKRKKNMIANNVKDILKFLRDNHIGKGVKLEIERELMNVMT